jgi:hypothetical protein
MIQVIVFGNTTFAVLGIIMIDSLLYCAGKYAKQANSKYNSLFFFGHTFSNFEHVFIFFEFDPLVYNPNKPN